MAGLLVSSNERRSASLITIRSLGSDIPLRLASMDTEDSPWGGNPSASAVIYVYSQLTGHTRCAFAIRLERQPYQSFRN